MRRKRVVTDEEVREAMKKLNDYFMEHYVLPIRAEKEAAQALTSTPSSPKMGEEVRS